MSNDRVINFWWLPVVISRGGRRFIFINLTYLKLLKNYFFVHIFQFESKQIKYRKCGTRIVSYDSILLLGNKNKVTKDNDVFDILYSFLGSVANYTKKNHVTFLIICVCLSVRPFCDITLILVSNKHTTTYDVNKYTNLITVFGCCYLISAQML